MEQPRRQIGRRPVLLGIAAATLLAAVRPARAAEKLRFGKSLADLFPYTPVDVGIAKGFFAARGLEVEIIAFQGAAKMQQGMVAGAIDFSIGSGSSMINVLKGVPSICIAETTAAPVEVGIVVPYDFPLRTADDLKGKKIGVATVGSVTEWMAFELARVKGWGPNGVVTVAVGGNQGNIGALRSNLVDAVVIDIGVGLELERKKEARLLLPCSDYVKDFIMHVIYGSKQITEEKPDAVRGFLAGWFEAGLHAREPVGGDRHRQPRDRADAAGDGEGVRSRHAGNVWERPFRPQGAGGDSRPLLRRSRHERQGAGYDVALYRSLPAEALRGIAG